MTAPAPDQPGFYHPDYGYLPPPPVVHPEEIRPKKVQYLVVSLLSVAVFGIGVGLFVLADPQTDSGSVIGVVLAMFGWSFVAAAGIGGQIGLILIAVKRGQHLRQLQVQRRAEQMGWIQPSTRPPAA